MRVDEKKENQNFADESENEFVKIAESELQYMNISDYELSLIRQKDGVVVWRVSTATESYVMKYFDKQEYRREISNYQILASLGIPTLKIIAYTDRSLLMEDIENSLFRLGKPEDVNDPKIAMIIADWYKKLHENGREYANTHPIYDESDCLTIENIKAIQDKTNTGGISVWKIIEENFSKIQSAIARLPRTLTYNDFHYTNFVVARDESTALIFDYNMLGKGYVYADIRNVCEDLGNEEARRAFLFIYGSFDEKEKIVDDVACILVALHIACKRKHFPDWGNSLLAMIKDGHLQLAVEKLLKG